ncbi:MAG TPA: hypothetical protein VJP07_10080 [Dehalococcoidia bacterium]|nr:hypothetical protein [Dehalococcoidia bacterium]
MAVAAPNERAQPASGPAVARAAFSWHWILLPLAVGATLALQLTTVRYYFYFDDYVPFAEIATQSRWDYVGHLLTSTDLTPNWRPLPGLLYLASYDIAGMDPLPVRLVMLAMHAGTAALLYYAIWRTTARAWAACFGALVFGLNPAYVGALSQVTTATQVMAGFFLVATLVAVLECARAEDRRASRAWLGASILLYVLTIGSHEGTAIMFPVFGLAHLTFDPDPDRRFWRSALRTAPLAFVALATAVSFEACGCNEGSEVWGTGYVWRQTLIYLGRLLYPVGLELPTDVNAPHAVGAFVLVAIMVAASAWGPKIARVGSLWALLAVAPHVFIEYFTASRYLYLPAPGLAMLYAAAAIAVADRAMRIDRRVLAASGATLCAALFAWYAYQTVRQDEHFADATADWRAYHDDVTRLWPELPPGTHVVTIGGPFQKYEYQLYILPAFAETTWGEGVMLQDYEPGSLPAQLALVSGSPYVAEYHDGELVLVFDGDLGDDGR